MRKRIAAGDVVKLKSGGPKLTVESMRDNGECNVRWFSGVELKQAVLRTDALVRKAARKERAHA